MNSIHTRSLIALIAMIGLLLTLAASPAQAQKKKAKQPAPKPKTEQVQEQDQEQAEPEQPREQPREVAAPPPSSGSFKDLLKQQIGKKTNLGTLKSMTGDYLVFEDENVTAMYPMHMVQSIKLIKEEEDSTPRVEIRMVSRD